MVLGKILSTLYHYPIGQLSPLTNSTTLASSILMNTTLENKVLLITGVNRGIGKALVEVALRHNPKKIYAAARNVASLPDFGDARVVPLSLDITDVSQVQKAAELAPDVQILINNAGVLAFAGVLEGAMADIENDMKVNYFGTLNVTRAFAPVIAAQGGGAIASLSSVVGLASMAGVGGYSASKAALTSAIQSMRAELKAKNIAVFGIFPGPIDTDMSRGFEMEKTSPTTTAENIFQAMSEGTEDIYPDPMSVQVGTLYATNPKAVETMFAAF